MPGQATEVWSHEFVRRFDRLDTDAQRRITAALRELGRCLESHPHQRMQGVKCYRLRVGDYRVIYEFERRENVLLLISVGHRREVYR